MGKDLRSTLQWQFQLIWQLAEYHLPKLTDENCLWEPSNNTWSVRRTEDGRWKPDFSETEPVPVPTVSVAWLTWQIIWWWSGAIAAVENRTPPTLDEVEWPGNAENSRLRIEELSKKWFEILNRLSNEDLNRPSSYPWPDPQPLSRMVAWVNAELMKNIAEIGYVLHLFNSRKISDAAK